MPGQGRFATLFGQIVLQQLDKLFITIWTNCILKERLIALQTPARLHPEAPLEALQPAQAASCVRVRELRTLSEICSRPLSCIPLVINRQTKFATHVVTVSFTPSPCSIFMMVS
jgi:hypothetical protein